PGLTQGTAAMSSANTILNNSWCVVFPKGLSGEAYLTSCRPMRQGEEEESGFLCLRESATVTCAQCGPLDVLGRRSSKGRQDGTCDSSGGALHSLHVCNKREHAA